MGEGGYGFCLKRLSPMPRGENFVADDTEKRSLSLMHGGKK